MMIRVLIASLILLIVACSPTVQETGTIKKETIERIPTGKTVAPPMGCLRLRIRTNDPDIC